MTTHNFGGKPNTSVFTWHSIEFPWLCFKYWEDIWTNVNLRFDCSPVNVTKSLNNHFGPLTNAVIPFSSCKTIGRQNLNHRNCRGAFPSRFLIVHLSQGGKQVLNEKHNLLVHFGRILFTVCLSKDLVPPSPCSCSRPHPLHCNCSSNLWFFSN